MKHAWTKDALQILIIMIAATFLAAAPVIVSASVRADQCASPSAVWEKFVCDPTLPLTALLAVFTSVLAWVSFRQLEAIRLTRDGIELTRESFIATHRPRLIVRYIGNYYAQDNAPEECVAKVTNVGATDATIIAFEGWMFRPKLENIGDKRPEPRPRDPVTLEPGGSYDLQVQSLRTYSDAVMFDAVQPGVELIAWGAVRYKDDNGMERETAFYQRYDENKRLFVSVRDAPEEYQD
jgi:hypothetical protein